MIALLDTSVLIALRSAGETPPELSGFDDLCVSSLSWNELTLGIAAARDLPTYKQRSFRLDVLQRTYGEGLAYDESCVEMFGQVLDRVVQRGGDPRAHRYDRMLAATAMAHDLTLVTRNAGDFRILDGLLDVVER